ncbi:MAG: YigZ family protein [Bacteroidota bacterium]|nr:YigZ family protein [Bacteroidota bacterium]
MIQDSYQTIASFSRIEIKVLNSRFIASAFPVTSKDGAEEILKKVRKEFYDANHNCFAYRIGMAGEVFRYSDDGEPSGTAGIKIFNVIQSKNLSDILVVVTRYFGGTKLGVGGLSRAYFEAALKVINNAQVIEKILMEEIKIKFPYDLISQVMHIISKFEVKVTDTTYGEDVIIFLNVRKGSVSSFTSELVEMCCGNINIETL